MNVRAINIDSDDLPEPTHGRLYNEWKPEEDAIVREYYPKMGAKPIHEKLPNRTWVAIADRASTLGVRMYKSEMWNEKEDNLLKTYYSTIPSKLFQEKFLPDRSIRAIYHRVKKLGLSAYRKSNYLLKWTDKEDMKILKHLNLGAIEIHRKYLPHRSIKSIQQHTREMGVQIKLDPRPKLEARQPWSEYEIKILQKHHKLRVYEISRRFLPHRTPLAIKNEAASLGLSLHVIRLLPWTKQEDKILRKHGQFIPADLIQIRFLKNRSVDAIQHRLYDLHIYKKKPKWKGNEDRLIKKLYPIMLAEKIKIKYLPHRSVESIRLRASLLGAIPNKKQWTGGEDKLLSKYYQHVGSRRLTQLFKEHGYCRTSDSIAGRASALGIKSGATNIMWTLQEDKKLIKIAKQTSGINNIKKFFPERTKTSVAKRLESLGITGATYGDWKNDELRRLITQYPFMDVRSFIDRYMPHRTREQVNYKAKRLGIKRYIRSKTNTFCRICNAKIYGASSATKYCSKHKREEHKK